MTRTIFTIMMAVYVLDMSLAGSIEQAKGQIFLKIGAIDQCEGKDASNYTLIQKFTEDQFCSPGTFEIKDTVTLTASASTGQKVVNTLKLLATTGVPMGGYYQQEVLYLATNGNLEGKYVYTKEIGLKTAYLNKCSSILGYSYVSTKSFILLIAEKLDLNVLLSPNGGYEPFKQRAQTVCNGIAYTV